MSGVVSSARRRPDILWRAVPGHLVLSTIDGRTMTADGPAAEVWVLVGDLGSVADVAAEMAERYAAPLDEVTDDIERLLVALADGGFVELGE